MTIPPWIYQTASGTPRDLGSFLALRSQGFGENVAYYQKLIGMNGHSGIDHPCPIGTPVYNHFPCRVRSISVDEKRGKGVVLEHSECRFLLWHFSEVLVSEGQEISGRIVVGLSGNSGLSTAPHVHAEKRPLDAQGNYLYPNNGFGGAVDFIQEVVWEPQPQNTKSMTEKEVRLIYRLAFYREPSGSELQFWRGKLVGQFLETAIKDRAAFLSELVV